MVRGGEEEFLLQRLLDATTLPVSARVAVLRPLNTKVIGS